MTSYFRKTVYGAAVATAMITTSIPAAMAQNDFSPSGEVTFIVPFGAGGGSDTLARTIVKVINDLDLVDNNIVVQNRPGGSGAIGYKYLADQKGDPTMLGTVSASFFATPLLGGSPVSYKDFTPVAAIAMSPYIMVVSAKSDIHSIKDLLSRDRITTGTVGMASDPVFLGQMIQDRADTKIDPIPFDGEGEVVAAVLGGHIDVMFGNPGEVMPQIKGGKLRPLAVSTDERLKELPDTPTFKQAGLDFDYVQLRGVILPKGVSDEAVAYWQNVFEKVAKSDEWEKQYLTRFGDAPDFLASEEFAKAMKKTNDRYEDLIERLGIGK